MELRYDSLAKNYGDTAALSDFSITMTAGVYGLIGPNGSGKTTLMNITAGVLKQSGGDIYLNGNRTDSLGREFYNHLGFLPQSSGFYGNFTGRMFMEYMAALKGLPQRGKELRKKIDSHLEQVNLLGEERKKIREYSGGMRRRLGIAQALLNNPGLLILDEPTAGLDPQERIRIRTMISTTAFDRIVILATHIVSDIESVAKEIVILKKGRICGHGSAAELTGNIEGMVWNCTVHASEAERFMSGRLISGVFRRDDFVEIRIISGVKPEENAVPVRQGLEDLYLWHFGERSGQ